MMQRVLKTGWVLLWLLILLIGSPPAHPVLAQDDVSWLLSQINNLRAGQGLPAYTLNAQLSAAATQQSQYLVETCNVAHVWPDGTSPANRAAAAGYTGSHVIENIFAGTNATAASAWNFFITSPTHYSGLVNTIVTEVGIGVAHGGLCSHAYTLVFGRAGDGSAPPVQAANPAAGPAAAPAPYVPPPPPSTPTATIPTLTPSATWTLTPSATPSATFTAITPTATPINLPTIPALSAQGSTAVAIVASPTPTEIKPTLTPSPIPPTLTPVLPTGTPVPTPRAASRPAGEGVTLRDLVPLALLGQIVLLGIAGFAYFRKSR